MNEIPKIQVLNPNESDHCLLLDDESVMIPLRLYGIVSYFNTRKPSIDDYQEALIKDNVIDLNVNEP